MTFQMDARAFGISLDQAKEDVEKALIKGVMDAGELLASTWKDYVPVDSGHYQQSIHAFLEDASPTRASAIVTSGLVADYDVYLEFGTHNNPRGRPSHKKHRPTDPVRMAARPSLRPAVEVARDAVAEALGRPVIEALT